MNTMLKELETLQQAEGNLLAVTEKYLLARILRHSLTLHPVLRMRTKEQGSKGSKIHVNQNLLHKWLVEVQQTKVCMS